VAVLKEAHDFDTVNRCPMWHLGILESGMREVGDVLRGVERIKGVCIHISMRLCLQTKKYIGSFLECASGSVGQQAKVTRLTTNPFAAKPHHSDLASTPDYPSHDRSIFR
jgi:hypothetical protein